MRRFALTLALALAPGCNPFIGYTITDIQVIAPGRIQIEKCELHCTYMGPGYWSPSYQACTQQVIDVSAGKAGKEVKERPADE